MSKTTKSDTPRTGIPPSNSLAITDGTQHAGWILEHGGEFGAFDANGNHIGDFASRRDAMRAIPSTSNQKETRRD